MREEVGRWVEQAAIDLKAADDNLKSKNYYLVALLCHQAIEKALKALYMLKKHRASPRTHSLVGLAAELQVPQQFRSTADLLNPAYIFTRYPDVAGEVPARLYTKDNVTPMLQKTKEWFRWIEEQLHN